MAMFAELIESETPELDEEGVRMSFIGRRDEVSAELREKMGWAEETTRANDRMKLFVAFNYGGRAEIVDAAERYAGGGEEEFAKLLYAPDMTDPDLLIRTSGEQRLSNFLLWQTAYSELYFADVLWPDFDEEHLVAALEDIARARAALRGALMATRRRNQGSDLGARVLAAIPAIIFAAIIVGYGGLVWALGVSLLGIVCLAELYKLMGRVQPANVAGFISVIALALAALYGDQFQILLVLVASRPGDVLPDARAAAARARLVGDGGRPVRDALDRHGAGARGAAARAAARRQPRARGADRHVPRRHAAYFGGRAFGRIPLAPAISPNKTLEGLACGVVGGTLAFWLFAVGYHDWITGTDALLIGCSVALAAPIGDLFESLIKRDLEREGHGPPLRRARRRARPPRRRVLHAS